MIKYPNGSCEKPKSTINKKKRGITTAANRGMDLENDINISNQYYLENDLAVITKRPTPINVVRVDYTHGAKITDAYFEKQSTTDYNGVYKGRYIDFEAKNTKSKSSFPLSNISHHQVDHLKRVIRHGGIAFFIIEFEAYNEIYLLDAKHVIDFINELKRKSIPYNEIKEHGYLIKQGFNPRLYYLDIIDKVYF